MKVPMVTDEMVLAAQSGDSDAMWHVVSAHDTIIRGIIRQVAPGASVDDADDLLQEGRAELVGRVRRYDSTQSAAQLQTYAYTHVRRAIVDAHLRASIGLTVEPSTILRTRKALADFDGNTEAAFLALQARHGMERGTFVAALEAMRLMEGLDTPIGSGAELTLADIIADPSADVVAPAERRALAHHLLTVVAPRQSYALAAHHGVGMMQTPDADVAAHLETPAHRVRQLRSDGARSARAYAARNAIAA